MPPDGAQRHASSPIVDYLEARSAVPFSAATSGPRLVPGADVFARSIYHERIPRCRRWIRDESGAELDYRNGSIRSERYPALQTPSAGIRGSGQVVGAHFRERHGACAACARSHRPAGTGSEAPSSNTLAPDQRTAALRDLRSAAALRETPAPRPEGSCAALSPATKSSGLGFQRLLPLPLPTDASDRVPVRSATTRGEIWQPCGRRRPGPDAGRR